MVDEAVRQVEFGAGLAGEPELHDAHPRQAEPVPQGVNLSSFPTTFFIGRDGLVRGTHAGFASPASGRFHAETKAEMIANVERLLAEPVHTSR